MKRLIAIIIAILTLLFGGAQTTDGPKDAPGAIAPAAEEAGFESRDTETESVTDLSTEKEMPNAVAGTEQEQPEVSMPSEPEITEEMAEQTVEPTNEPIPDTSFSQLTKEEPIPEEQTEIPDSTVAIEQPEVIQPTPVIEETSPQKTEEKTDDAAPADTVPSGNASVFVDPAQGGPNPFENAPPTEINDHPVDEFIGEGDDRPGEGIHF